MRREKLRSWVFVLFGLLCFSQLTAFSYASGGSKVTTFHIKDYFSPTVCDLVVYFSWDSDSWEIGDEHTVSFSFEVQNINSEISNLSMSLKNIIVRLKSDAYSGAVDIVNEDVSNQITSMVWRKNYATFFTTTRSFSYQVETPKPYKPLNEDSNTKLYYWVELIGYYAHDDIDMGNGVTLKAGSHQLEGWAYVSNEGGMIGGIEDPVWITIKAEPSFSWLYIVMAIALIGSGATLSVFFLVRHRKVKPHSQNNPLPR